MTLHSSTEVIKKVFIFCAIGIGSIILLVLVFRLGVIIKNIAAPPKTVPPNQAYGPLTPLQFPNSLIANNFIYNLNTLSGTLPADFPDRLNVYPLVKNPPNLLNLNSIKTKVQTLGFFDQQGNTLPEKSIGNGIYEWDEQKGINRVIKFNVVTFDFSMTSNYLSSPTVLSAQNISDENNAIQTAQTFLQNIGLLPTDIDLAKTQTPGQDVNYIIFPQLFTIKNGVLTHATSLSATQVIRVDLYQKDVSYDLDTGRPGAAKIKMDLPILYPHPPYSTMSFYVASGQNNAEVDALDFTHREISFGTDVATYPIKTAQNAFDELKNGNAYIASYSGSDKQILISNVYLAYYIGGENQDYLMPIIVFEGQNNFFAFVPAVK